jgi:hypothetical protein
MMQTHRQRKSQGRDPKLVKLAIQTTRCSTAYTIGGHRKEGNKAPRQITLPKFKCLDEEPSSSQT